MKKGIGLWLIVAIVCLVAAGAAYLFWPRDKFAALRRFHPEEGDTGPQGLHYLNFTQAPDEIRRALGIPPGKAVWFKLPNGDSACFMELYSDKSKCQVWVFNDPSKSFEAGSGISPPGS